MISIYGLYLADPSIFDNMVLPASVDKEVLAANILLECHELEVLYADPEYMKHAIGMWSLKQKSVWDHLAEAFELEYNPLYNVDAHEILTETRNLKGTVGNKETRNLEMASSNTETINLSNDEDATNTRSVTGYNSADWADSEQEVSDIGRSETGTIDNAGASSDTGTIENAGESTDTGTIITENRRFGNIGVTKSTDLIQSELDVRPKLNIYRYIIEDFKSRFILLIY